MEHRLEWSCPTSMAGRYCVHGHRAALPAREINSARWLWHVAVQLTFPWKLKGRSPSPLIVRHAQATQDRANNVAGNSRSPAAHGIFGQATLCVCIYFSLSLSLFLFLPLEVNKLLCKWFCQWLNMAQINQSHVALWPLLKWCVLCTLRRCAQQRQGPNQSRIKNIWNKQTLVRSPATV